MNRNEENALIANFMGLSYCDKYQYEGWYLNHEHNNRICDYDGLQYHKSWEWIMPVIAKIKITKHIQGWEYHNAICASLINIDITGIHKEIVKYIKSYNE